MMTKKVCLIPARYDATRYPGKLMKRLGGKTVIRYTYDNVFSMQLFDYVAVVTNSIDIKNEIEAHGGNVIYNQTEHHSGSDRIAEAVDNLDADIIINVQGDEPFVRREPLVDLLKAIDIEVNDTMVASLMRPMDNESHIESSNFVKVVCDKNNLALYFSRSVIPFQKTSQPMAIYYEHIGVYAFTRKALIKFSNLKPTTLEQIESIECLRYLENGIPIKMVKTDFLILEIDTEADLELAEELIKEGRL
jgi:3-deoxy-manno-octulosonate cytidylyltransferase (CMP-KDO synthetase)